VLFTQKMSSILAFSLTMRFILARMRPPSFSLVCSLSALKASPSTARRRVGDSGRHAKVALLQRGALSTAHGGGPAGLR